MAPQTRVVLVALIAGMVLAIPFQVSAGSSKRITKISHVENTVAGLGTTVEIESKRKNQSLLLTLEDGEGESHQLEVESDSDRKAEAVIPGDWLETAGDYRLYLNADQEASTPLTVFAGAVSETTSSLALKSDELELQEMGELRVKLTDEFGNAIEGHILDLNVDDSDVTHYSPEFATDENGEMTFYFSSKRKGEAEIKVIDKTANKEIGEAQQVSFTMMGRGGSSIELASTTDVSELKISGLPSSAKVGEALSFSVSALDSDEVVSGDYEGTIEFESSDSRADLPSDYTFEADDVGEHRFNLSLRFASPGKQTFTVRDSDQPDLEVTVSVDVKLDDGSDVDLGNDFETVDFKRDGDFTLVSPATGEYSESDIEVQGEADYGFDVIIYLDDKEVGRTEVEFDNSFQYTIENLKDGTYELRADVVELGDGEPGKEEIVQVTETSDTEEITVDTTAPDLKDLQIDPEDNLEAGDTIEVTILSEKNLEDVSVVVDEEVFDLNETRTDGKYTGDVKLPSKEGDYDMDVILKDALGNEAEFRNELSLEVGKTSVTEDVTPTDTAVAAEAPTGVVVVGGEGKVTLSWDPSESNEVDFYRIYYGPSAEALHAVTETDDSATSWTIPDLQPEQTLYFVVVPVLKDGDEGKYSNVVVGMPKGTASAEKPGVEEGPAYDAEHAPEEVPDAGPALNLLLGLSGATALFLTRRSVRMSEL